MNEIVEAFGFGEIEFAVFKRAAGEFAGLSRPHISERRQCGEHRGDNRAPAMNVKLGDVFAGRAGRPGKPEHHGIIDRPLAYIVEQRPGSSPRRRHFFSECRQRRPGFRSRYADDSNRARRPARRQGEDGLIPWMHRLFVGRLLKRQKQFQSVIAEPGIPLLFAAADSQCLCCKKLKGRPALDPYRE